MKRKIKKTLLSLFLACALGSQFKLQQSPKQSLQSLQLLQPPLELIATASAQPVQTESDSIDWRHWRYDDFIDFSSYGRWKIFDDWDNDIAMQFKQHFFYDTLTIIKGIEIRDFFIAIPTEIGALKNEVVFDASRDIKFGNDKKKIDAHYLEGINEAVYARFNPGKLIVNRRTDAPYTMPIYPQYPLDRLLDIVTVGASRALRDKRTFVFKIGSESRIGQTYYKYEPEFIESVNIYYGREKWPITKLSRLPGIYKKSLKNPYKEKSKIKTSLKERILGEWNIVKAFDASGNPEDLEKFFSKTIFLSNGKIISIYDKEKNKYERDEGIYEIINDKRIHVKGDTYDNVYFVSFKADTLIFSDKQYSIFLVR